MRAAGMAWRFGPTSAFGAPFTGAGHRAIGSIAGSARGVLLGKARRTDVVDAALVLLTLDGDSVLTSDPEDILHLAVSAGLDIEIVPV